MSKNKIDPKDSLKHSYKEDEISCINCEYLDGVDCSLERDEDFQDGKNCPKFIAWWNC